MASEESDVPFRPETVWLYVEVTRVGNTRLGIPCRASTTSAFTLVGEAISIAAGIAAAKGKAAAIAPVLPRNFLRDTSVLLICTLQKKLLVSLCRFMPR